MVTNIKSKAQECTDYGADDKICTRSRHFGHPSLIFNLITHCDLANKDWPMSVTKLSSTVTVRRLVFFGKINQNCPWK